jgi:hypothetical protein
MARSDYTHVAFADESNWNQGRYRSISLVSAAVQHARIFHYELDALRKTRNKLEFKWVKTDTRHGVALADFFFERLQRMRVDVLIWDVEDSRHKEIKNRDDRANFGRMYYHLLHNVLERRWPQGSRWLICPDEQKEVDWLTLEACLGRKGRDRDAKHVALATEVRELRYSIREIRCVSSTEYLLVQLADMFAGLAAYSYSAFDKYRQWKSDSDATRELFDTAQYGERRLKVSKRDKERLPVLDHVRHVASTRGLQISLKSTRGLSTRNASSPLNFWLYTPQRQHDKAPITLQVCDE